MMTTVPYRIRSPRASTLRALAFTTALAGGAMVFPSVAWAQELPTGRNPGTVSGGSLPTFTDGTTPSGGAKLDVNLNANSSVIGWSSFNIGAGNEVNFKTALSGDVAVLNKVTGGNMSEIRGALNSDANVSVFLVNPNGIMVHSSGSISTGSFVASTLNFDDNEFLAKRYIFTAPGQRSTAITVNGSITTRGTGIGLVLLAPKIVSTGALDSGTQDIALVAATGVTLNYTAGSPLGIRIDEGTSVPDGMRVGSGTIQGRNVYFAMATQSGVTNALLEIDADVRAVGGDKGVVIVGGRATIGNVAVDGNVTADTSGRVNVRTGGYLEYAGGVEGGVRIGATGSATVASAVESAGDFTVTGRSVTLGASGATVLQRANGAVQINATNGDVNGRGVLTLISDRDGTVGEDTNGDGTLDRSHAMTLRGENINFDTTTTLVSGGSGLASAINIFSDANGDIKLGDVAASTLDGGVGINSIALQGGVLRDGSGSSFTAGNITLGGIANIKASSVSIGTLTAAGNVTLEARNALRIGSVRSTGGDVALDADTLSGRTATARADVDAAGAIDIDANESVLLGTVKAGSTAIIETDSNSNGAIDITLLEAGTAATINGDDDVTLGGLTVLRGSATVTADDTVSLIGPVAVSGDYSVEGNAVTLGGVQSAGGAVTITAGSGQIGNSGTLTLTANSDGVGTEALTLDGRINLGRSTTTLNGGTARQSDVIIVPSSGTAINLGNINAAALKLTNASPLSRAVTLGNVVTTADLILSTSSTITAGNLQSTGGLVNLQAIELDLGDVRAATSVSLSGPQVRFDTIDAATVTLATTGGSGTRLLSGGDITASGAVTLTSSGGAITIDGIVAGTLDITSSGAVTLDNALLTGTAAITTTGNADIRITDILTAAGAVTIKGARDVSAGRLVSSNDALSITASGDVRGINGGGAALSAATDLVLSAGGDALLGTVSGNTLDLSADTIDSQALSGLGGITAKATDGDLIVTGLTTTGGNVSLTASGEARVDGVVDIVGDYSVAGASVRLGGTQKATGLIELNATSNNIFGDADLDLMSNSDGVGTEALILRGRALLDVASVLRGGNARQSQVILGGGPASNFRLGDVEASSLSIAGGAALSGNLTIGNVTTADAIALTIDGVLSGGALRSLGGSVTLNGAGSVDLGDLSAAAGLSVAMTGDVKLGSFAANGGAASFASTGGQVALQGGSASGDVIVNANGLARIDGAIAAGGAYRVRGASVRLGDDAGDEVQQAVGAIDITATSGDIVGGQGLALRSGGTLILDAADAIDLGAGSIEAGTDGAGQLGLRAGSGETIDLGDAVKAGMIGSVSADHATIAGALTHAGDLRFGTLTTGTLDVQLSGGGITGDTLTSSGAVTLNTGAGAIDLGEVTGTTVTVTGGAITGGRYAASGDIALTGRTITLAELASSDGSARATATAGTLSIDSASAAVDMVLRTTGTGDVSVGTATAGRNLTLDADAGNVRVDTATAGGTLTLAASGDILGRTGPGANLSGNDIVLTLDGNLTTSSIAAPGSLSVTAASMDLGSASAGAALNLTTTRGDLSIDSVTAGGAVSLSSAAALNAGEITAGGNVTLGAQQAVSVQQVNAPGTLAVTAGGTASLGTGTVATLTVDAAAITLADMTVTGGSTLEADGSIAITRLTTGSATLTGETLDVEELTASGDVTAEGRSDLRFAALDARNVTLTAPGSATLGRITADGLIVTGGSIGIEDATVTGTTTLDVASFNVTKLTTGTAALTASGTATLGTLTAQTLTLTAANIDAGTLDIAAAAKLIASGVLSVDSLTAGTDADVQGGGEVRLGTLRAQKAVVNAPGLADIGTITADALTITGGNVAIDDATVTGAITAQTSGTLEIGRLAVATAELKAGTATLGTVTANSLSVNAGGISAQDLTITGGLTLTSTGDLRLDRASAATLALDAAGMATLGSLTGTSGITVRAGDVTLSGAVKAPTVTFASRDPAAGLRLGGADDGPGTGLGLSEAEIGRIDAERAIFDGGTGPVRIGTLAFPAAAGAKNVDVLTTGEIAIEGVVSGSGTGRVFRFGGTSANDTDMASAIRILATADAGGRLFFAESDVELRGARIGLGQSGFIDDLFGGSGLTPGQVADYVGNPDSPLYSALAGGSPYLPDAAVTLSAGRLTLRFRDFALFQNTGVRGFNTGVVLNGSAAGGPTLNLIGAPGSRPAFAMFGSINGVTGTSSAVLGPGVVSVNSIDVGSSRINGCVLGSGAGCLTTTIAQPTFNIFDPGRLVVFRTEQDFTIPFDPVIGSNNEALFSGISGVSDAAYCPPGDASCAASQGEEQ